jgi:hypothetical protein
MGELTETGGQYIFMSVVIFWDVTPCDLVAVYKGFGGTYTLKIEAIRCSDTLANSYYTASQPETPLREGERGTSLP